MGSKKAWTLQKPCILRIQETILWKQIFENEQIKYKLWRDDFFKFFLRKNLETWFNLSTWTEVLP